METLGSPDTRTPLHPTELSEGAASLLPGQVRPALLCGAVGQVFEAVVVDLDGKGHSTVALRDPAVRARCDGELELGASVRVRLTEADPGRRVVRFTPA